MPIRHQGVNEDGEEISSAYVVHAPVDWYPEGPSRTRSEFAEECDINALMARYEATGVISHVNPRQPMYADLSVLPSNLAEAMAVLREAEASFMSLPATVRREFDNDPQKWVAFAEDPENRSQMETWGLTVPKPVPQPPMKVEVVPSEPPPAPPGEQNAKP